MFAQFKQLTWKASLLASVVSLLAFTIALAASGDLDTSFSGDGLVITDISGGQRDDLSAIAIQSNGKIVAAGARDTGGNKKDFVLIRYNSNGSLDTIFSKRFIDFGGNDASADVALQSDGKIVVSGTVCDAPSSIGGCDVALARYNTTGTLDNTFSEDGKQITDFGGKSNSTDGGLAIQSDGKIVVAGTVANATSIDFAIYRYLSNGDLDTTFSGDGKVHIGFGAGNGDFSSDLVLQSDGKILITGPSRDASGNTNFAIARLNTNGALDTTFSGDGKKITDFGGDDYPDGLTVQPDGKIVVVGLKGTDILVFFAIARYNLNGNLDNTFGTVLPTGKRNGKRVFSIVAGVDSEALDVIVQPDGKIVVVGYTRDTLGFRDFALVRLKPNGGFDTTFGNGGKVTVDFADLDSGRALARQPADGKYVLAGVAGPDPTQLDFALARVLP